LIVTEVQGGSNGNWTGIGYTEIPYLKGQRIAVEFTGASVNDCYEFTGQSGKIQSAYDPSWGGVTSIDNPLDQVRSLMQQLSDLLNNYKPGDKAKLQQLTTEIGGYVQAINADTTLTSDQRQQLVGAVNSTKEAVDCFVSASGGRRSADSPTCSLEDTQKSATLGYSLAVNVDNSDCPCQAPKLTGAEKEGDQFTCQGETNVTYSTFQIAPTKVNCFQTYTYFAGYTGSSYAKGWYTTFGYKQIAKFIENKVAPVIFIHGTFSNSPDAFTTGFREDVLKTLGPWTAKAGYSNVEWSGGNNSKTREQSATDLSNYLNSDLGKGLLVKSKSPLHVTLVTHSHGGNVAKLIKQKLEATSAFWIVDLVNIETPPEDGYSIA